MKLGKDKIYIIIDRHAQRPKIWIWSGSDSGMMDRYFAGVSATKIKSQLKLYGASIEVVESGNEPEHFPLLSKDKIIESVKDSEPFVLEEEVVSTTQEESELEAQEAEMISEISETTKKIAAIGKDSVNKLSVISFFDQIKAELDKIRRKIDTFLSDL